MLWDWGFNWKSVAFQDVRVAIDAGKADYDGALGRVKGTGVSRKLCFVMVFSTQFPWIYGSYKPNIGLMSANKTCILICIS